MLVVPLVLVLVLQLVLVLLLLLLLLLPLLLLLLLRLPPPPPLAVVQALANAGRATDTGGICALGWPVSGVHGWAGTISHMEQKNVSTPIKLSRTRVPVATILCADSSAAPRSAVTKIEWEVKLMQDL